MCGMNRKCFTTNKRSFKTNEKLHFCHDPFLVLFFFLWRWSRRPKKGSGFLKSPLYVKVVYNYVIKCNLTKIKCCSVKAMSSICRFMAVCQGSVGKIIIPPVQLVVLILPLLSFLGWSTPPPSTPHSIEINRRLLHLQLN